MDLTGKKALVTGGTAGIGRAIALELARAGASVALFGQNVERGNSVVEEIRTLHPQGEALFFPVDVSDAAAVEKGVKQVLEPFGGIDILVNNAGITRDQLLMRMKEEEWDAVLATNLKSCFLLTRQLVRPMMKKREGKIINISSVVGVMGNVGQANYAASKAAMIGFTKSMAKELASRNIQVNAIAPGFIETAMTDALPEATKEEILRNVPMGRLGKPEEIAHTALFLASPLSNYITGQVVTVDGGMVM